MCLQACHICMILTDVGGSGREADLCVVEELHTQCADSIVWRPPALTLEPLATKLCPLLMACELDVSVALQHL